MKYLIMLCAMLVATAQAEEYDWAVGGLLFSDHHGETGIKNENHYKSLYFRLNGWVVGKYENSYSTDDDSKYSRFIGHQFELEQWNDLEFSATVGVVDGYKGLSTEEQLSPLAAFSVKYYFVKAHQFGVVSALGWEIDNKLFDRLKQ